jgi:mannose-6-phosphate isomerase
MEGRPAGPESCLTLYQPPFEEFEVQRLEAGYGGLPASVSLAASQGPRILMVQGGEAEAGLGPQGLPDDLASVPGIERSRALRRGSILLLPAGVELALRRAEGFVAWLAAVNAAFFALQDVRAGSPATGGAAADVPAANDTPAHTANA